MDFQSSDWREPFPVKIYHLGEQPKLLVSSTWRVTADRRRGKQPDGEHAHQEGDQETYGSLHRDAPVWTASAPAPPAYVPRIGSEPVWPYQPHVALGLPPQVVLPGVLAQTSRPQSVSIRS